MYEFSFEIYRDIYVLGNLTKAKALSFWKEACADQWEQTPTKQILSPLKNVTSNVTKFRIVNRHTLFIDDLILKARYRLG